MQQKSVQPDALQTKVNAVFDVWLKVWTLGNWLRRNWSDNTIYIPAVAWSSLNVAFSSCHLCSVIPIGLFVIVFTVVTMKMKYKYLICTVV